MTSQPHQNFVARQDEHAADDITTPNYLTSGTPLADTLIYRSRLKCPTFLETFPCLQRYYIQRSMWGIFKAENRVPQLGENCLITKTLVLEHFINKNKSSISYRDTLNTYGASTMSILLAILWLSYRIISTALESRPHLFSFESLWTRNPSSQSPRSHSGWCRLNETNEPLKDCIVSRKKLNLRSCQPSKVLQKEIFC